MVRKDVMLAWKLKNEAKDSLSFLRSHTTTIYTYIWTQEMSEESKWFHTVNHKTNIRGIIYLFRGKKVYTFNVNKTNSSFQIKPINVLLQFQEKINFSYSCSDSNNNCLNLFTVKNTWNAFAHSTTNPFSLEFILSRTIGVIQCSGLKAVTNSLLVLTLRWSLIYLPLNLGWPHWLSRWIKFSRIDPGIPKVKS